MADTTDNTTDIAMVVERLRESRPPATDTFTYLTIVEKSLSPQILPALHDILQEDTDLTRDIGWDLVGMLIPVAGSEACLETIAQLGNPREVMLMVYEVMAKARAAPPDDGEDEDGDSEFLADALTADEAAQRFVVLLGMLAILHKRLEVSAPSRFILATLQTVCRCYDPKSPQATAAIIALVRSLSGAKRPRLPTRKSSTKLAAPFDESDEAKNAPDPEAEEADAKLDPAEPALITRMLQSFATSVIEAYVSANALDWAARLAEHYHPERVVPGRKSKTEEFKEQPELLERDALIGQLAAIADDLELSEFAPGEVEKLFAPPGLGEPLLSEERFDAPDQIKLSTTGFWCLKAYLIFAADMFGAGYKPPDSYIFPDHFNMLKLLLEQDPGQAIAAHPGAIEALLVIGMRLMKDGKWSAEQETVNLMQYHHLLTLCSVFHPSLSVRNAATNFAGLVLHSSPDDADRLKILEDLLENCVFSSLQACAVTWLREELVSAKKDGGSKSPFATAEALERLEYVVFPSMAFVEETEPAGLLEWWAENSPFHLQVANFGYLLFAGNAYSHAVPEGMRAAIEQRYVVPLLAAAKRLEESMANGSAAGLSGEEGNLLVQLKILVDRLESIPLQ